jgi:glycosyltransferase involved in cell wall biosynthesis
VHFLGFRPHDEIPRLLAGADVLVLPSLYEELGSVLLEGLQAGVPIVASDAGGIPDALGDAGVLVPPRDPGALAAAIDRLLRDARLRAALSQRARTRARRYDWNLLADRVLDVYRAVDGESPAHRPERAADGVLA